MEAKRKMDEDINEDELSDLLDECSLEIKKSQESKA